ncbi:MAG: stage V sporulation protein AC [Clostridia bacterium]|nr:stage V sporulation protein AC [Clostridia bacterium]
MNNADYKKYTTDRAKRSSCLLNSVKAFFVGGFICCIGQALFNLYLWWGADENTARTLVSVTLIFAAGLLTGIGVFDKIGKFSGAGTLVPITGFANAIAAPAIENKTEGKINGVCSKMFVMAGPVIVFGTLSSAIYGLVYYIVTKVL